MSYHISNCCVAAVHLVAYTSHMLASTSRTVSTPLERSFAVAGRIFSVFLESHVLYICSIMQAGVDDYVRKAFWLAQVGMLTNSNSSSSKNSSNSSSRNNSSSCSSNSNSAAPAAVISSTSSVSQTENGVLSVLPSAPPRGRDRLHTSIHCTGDEYTVITVSGSSTVHDGSCATAAAAAAGYGSSYGANSSSSIYSNSFTYNSSSGNMVPIVCPNSPSPVPPGVSPITVNLFN
jgi:hypothetical protein